MDKFRNKYRIQSARLQGYDYGSNGMYFVTICTQNRLHYFGEITESNGDGLLAADADNGLIVDADNGFHVEADNYPPLREIQYQPTEIGKMAFEFWNEIPQHFPFVVLDAFVIMPNHVHGILIFEKPNKTDWTPNKFGTQSQNLGSVLRGFKASLKRYANQKNIEFGWQSRFHDHIIRNEIELKNIRAYIRNNAMNWVRDRLNKAEKK